MRQGTRVLMVEDDRCIAELVAMELEHRGIEVLCAPDGSSGLEAARRFRPDVIVLDVMLPGLDGVGVLKRLRDDGVGGGATKPRRRPNKAGPIASKCTRLFAASTPR